jgi:glycosyltransferase involved in cell wall biosynthesis
MTVPLKVAIDARTLPGLTGGVAVAVKSLLQGLGQLVDGDEEYTVIVQGEEQRAWVSSFLGPNQRIVLFQQPQHRGVRGLAFRVLRPIARYVRRELDQRVWPEVPISQGFHESLGCHVLHLPTQVFTLCAMPTIYNPHDLQHLRYPQFFSPNVLSWRETIYPAGCHFAQTVVVGSQWIREDVVSRYRVDPDKIQVIPEAAPSQTWDEPSEADLVRARKLHGFESFIVFPGVAWPHKNHLQLFHALARLRDERGITIRLVCTGARYPAFWPKIEEAIRELRLSTQVKFLGYVPEAELRAIYRQATCLVLPSLYEASSLPIFEAWLDGVPVVCSNAAALPQQVQNAALLFDPTDVNAIADTVCRAVMDAELRRMLQTRGYERLKDFDLQRTAKAYRAVYRRAGGLPLTEEDRWLLHWDWMRGVPQRDH